ncbi:aromatic-ring-hydroxylating dioxygenase subunit alpha [Pigmentiphaga soli]|uniref:Aromatic-ring-hydroxylating dioxygenase subunit alpha n=1 Tax=Pigmentiphaga soli TaxID=1007095 RepID=A0ABP8HC97_9BURK
MNAIDRPWRMPDPDALVHPDRVHRDVYTSPEIFELEMTRIFGRAWLYIGHESQVPEPGDYLAAWMGRMPVLLVRDHDRRIQVLHNRCSHRGTMLVTDERGNTGNLLRCPYHGWTFRTNGELVLAPMRDAYADRYDMTDQERFGLAKVPRVDTHRGFVFASLAPAADPMPGLLAFLGPAAQCIDQIVDRAPDGEVRLSGGMHRYIVPANWKQQVENVNDLYHPQFAHACSVDERNRQFKRRIGDDAGPHLDVAERGSKWDEVDITAFDWGLGYCGRLPFEDDKRGGPLVQAHRAALARRHPPGRIDAILEERFHNVVIYPSVVMQLASSHVRVVRPLAPDRTEIRIFPVLLQGAPDEINTNLIRFLNMTHAAASLIQTDDVEMFRRVQGGLEGAGSEWVWFNRYMGADRDEGEVRRAKGTSEIGMRNQFQGWLKYMKEAV